MPKPSSAAVGRARHAGIPASAEQVRSVSALLRILRSAFTRVHRVSRLECWMLSRERADAKVPAHFHSHRGLSPVMKGHSRFWGSGGVVNIVTKTRRIVTKTRRANSFFLET